MSDSDPSRSSSSGPTSSERPSAPATEGLPDEFVLTPEYVEEEAIRGDIVLRGAVILLAALFGWTQITNTAALVQIRTGQELAAHGVLPPRTDTFFSYTAADAPWVNLSWLGDLLLAGLYGLGRAAILSVSCGLLVGVTFWLLGRTSVRGAPTWWGSLCAGLAVVAVFPLLTPGPTLWTVVGLGVTLFLLHRGGEEPAGRAWWGLAPVLLLWSNLDPRAYLGMLLILLYLVGRWLNGPTGEMGGNRALWVALVAGLVNPFPIAVLQSPVTLMRRLHPLRLEYAVGDAADYPYLWQSVVTAVRDGDPSWHLTAAIVLALLTLATLLLNRRGLHWGEVLATLGLNALALAAAVDFAAVAVVNAVMANLNGQRWYRAACRQQYSLDKRELLFSRAGRAATVCALFATAYWGVSGWMTGPAGRRIGFGFSHRLSRQIEGYADLLGQPGVDEFDDRPFHVTPQQGDLLIWHGRRSFTDSRLLLFAADGGPNLLERQREVASALLSPDQPLTSTEAIEAWAHGWQKTFDEYSITHVVVPLETPDGYRLWVNLASQGIASASGEATRFWMPTGISGPATTLYRLDLPAGETRGPLLEFLREHGEPSIVQQTFRRDDEREWTRRGVFPRGPTYYETSLLLPQPATPSESLLARHYATRVDAAQRGLFETIAYCHQIIRHARRGLAENPNSAETYLLLGQAYMRLWQAEVSAAANRLALDAADRRFLQAVFAFHHASQCRPHDVEPHALLYQVYLEHGEYDLALRHLDRIEELTGRYTLLTPDDPNYDAGYQQAKRLRGVLAEALQQAENAVAKARIGGLESSLVAAVQARCPGYALQLLEDDLTLTVANPELVRSYGRLLLLSGRTLDGLQQLENQLRGLETGATPPAMAQSVRPYAALANLAADDYDRAYELWETFGRETLQEVLRKYLLSLPGTALPGTQGDAWPVFQIATAAEALGRWLPEWELAQWQMAMTELESGRNTQAERLLEGVLTANPQTLLRPQIAMYLSLLTGQSVEPYLPEAGTSSRYADRPPSPALPVRTQSGGP